MSTNTKDVFISYGRTDQDLARRLASELQRLRLTVWFDAALEPGTSFDEEIAEQVSNSRAVLVCWTKRSVTSRWVRGEAHVGAQQKKLVPVFLEKCELPPPFNVDHTEDLGEWQGDRLHEGFQKVLKRLGALTARGDALAKFCQLDRANASDLRIFLNSFSADPLAADVKQAIWTLETDDVDRRLAQELGREFAPSGDRTPAMRAAEDRIGSLEASLEESRSLAQDASVRIEALESELSEMRKKFLESQKKLTESRAKARELKQQVQDLETPAQETDSKVWPWIAALGVGAACAFFADQYFR